MFEAELAASGDAVERRSLESGAFVMSLDLRAAKINADLHEPLSRPEAC